MRILQICAEIYPLLKTGGLADVTAALPPALRALGCEPRVLLPGFPAIRDSLADARPVARLQGPGALAAIDAQLLLGRLPACDVDAFVIDAPACYARDGGPYADAGHQPYADNHLRFALLGWTGAALARGMDPAWRPERLHVHDWHAALAPAYLRAAAEAGENALPGCVYTVHNLAYQGLFDASRFAELGLPAHFFSMHGLEFHGQVSFMKAGLYYSDRITTVSPGYAREIQGPEQGCGLDGLLRERAHELSGILNGVDDAVWNPATDTLLAARYDATRLAGKARCRKALRAELGLADNADGPLYCVVSRLTEQKGLHLVLQALPAIVAGGGQFALLGSGDAALEAAFGDAAAARPDAVAVHLGYDEAFAHRLIAGSDVILVPSRFEPCGLTQLYGLRYGCVPVVARTGGLADTVADASLETLDTDATGFVFEEFSAAALARTITRAGALFRRGSDWKTVQRRAMAKDFGWQRAAERYVALYRQISG